MMTQAACATQRAALLYAARAYQALCLACCWCQRTRLSSTDLLSVQFFRLGFSSHTAERCLQPPRSLFRNVYRRILAVALRDSSITARDRQEKLLRQRTIHKLVVCLSGSFDQRPALAAGCFFLARSIVLGGVCVKLPWFEQGLLTARSPHPLVKFHGLFP